MLADCSACDPRNPFPGQVFAVRGGPNLHPATAEIDYRGREVNVDSILAVLTGHHPISTAPSRRLDTDQNSTVLLYLTGHGGDGFLKFHDQSELLSSDIAAAVKVMHAAGRYKQLLMVLDTCQAATLYNELSGVPGWGGIASSKLGQSSYALHSDPAVGAHLVDEFTHYLASYLETIPIPVNDDGDDDDDDRQNRNDNKNRNKSRNAKSDRRESTMDDLLRYIRSQRLSSEVDVDFSNLGKSLGDLGVLEFFGDNSSYCSGGGSSCGDDDDSERWQVPDRPSPSLIVETGGGGGEVRGGGKIQSAGDESCFNSDMKVVESGGDEGFSSSLHDVLISAWA